MFYKPNYCCNCGEKIERIEWHLWTNRRFCEICETDYQVDDWLKRIIPGVFLFIGILGIGSYLRSQTQPVGTTEHIGRRSQTNSSSRSTGQPASLKTAGSSAGPSGRQPPSPTPSVSEGIRQSPASSPPAPVVIPAESPEIVSESPQNKPARPVYFCGAQTKKGKPCSRRVRGGGRCWQHVGHEAMLSENDLRVVKR